MQQAGIDKIVLYENKELTFLYYDADTIVNLVNTGEILTFVNDELPYFFIEPEKNFNAKIAFNYGAQFTIFLFNDASVDKLTTIVQSIYAWKIVIYFLDGTIKFLDELLIFEKSVIDPNESMSFVVKLNTKQPSEKTLIDYDDTISMSEYKADTTLLKADTTLYTADYY